MKIKIPEKLFSLFQFSLNAIVKFNLLTGGKIFIVMMKPASLSGSTKVPSELSGAKINPLVIFTCLILYYKTNMSN